MLQCNNVTDNLLSPCHICLAMIVLLMSLHKQHQMAGQHRLLVTCGNGRGINICAVQEKGETPKISNKGQGR